MGFARDPSNILSESLVSVPLSLSLSHYTLSPPPPYELGGNALSVCRHQTTGERFPLTHVPRLPFLLVAPAPICLLAARVMVVVLSVPRTAEVNRKFLKKRKGWPAFV